MLLVIACSGGSVLLGSIATFTGAGGTWSIAVLIAGLLGLVGVASRTAFTTTVLDEGTESLSSVLARELERGRRHGREFAVVRVALNDHRAVQDMAGRLRLHVRRIDTVCADDEAVYVVASETTRDGAELVLQRALGHARAHVDSTAIAVFPQDALTAGDLVAHLQGRALREADR